MINGGRARGVRKSVANEAEGVTCRVCVDPPTALGIAEVEQRGPELENLFLGLVEILDTQVKVELLRASGIRPPRRLMVLRALEGEHEPRVGVEGRPVAVKQPSRIRLVHHAAEKRQVERGELTHIGTVQHHTLQLGYHNEQRRPATSRAP